VVVLSGCLEVCALVEERRVGYLIFVFEGFPSEGGFAEGLHCVGYTHQRTGMLWWSVLVHFSPVLLFALICSLWSQADNFCSHASAF